MIRRKREFEIFSLSFLDIISCGFGAVVLLVLISNTSTNDTTSSVDEAGTLLKQVLNLETKVSSLMDQVDEEHKKNDDLLSQSDSLASAAATLSKQLGQKEDEDKSLDGDLEGLSLVKESLKRISITPSTTKTTRDIEVGGIPVDSDYVMFIVDTSGSMQDIWARVSKEILNVLRIHPQVKGFQILNDNGKALISAYSGKWIKDTPSRRKSVMNVFGKWTDASNSSPVEGIERALKTYTKPGRSVSIYVFGDDYTGSSYDPVIARLTRMNTNKITGKKLSLLHVEHRLT